MRGPKISTFANPGLDGVTVTLVSVCSDSRSFMHFLPKDGLMVLAVNGTGIILHEKQLISYYLIKHHNTSI